MSEMLNKNQAFDSPGEALSHYGKKGMKWGVTTKGPHASEAKQQRKQEKRDVKIGSLTSRAAKVDIRISEIKSELAATPTGLRTHGKRANLRQELKSTIHYRDSLNKAAESVRAGKLTPNQKRLLIGGAIAGGIFLAGYGLNKAQSGEINSLKLRGAAALHGKKFDFRKNEAFAGDLTADQILANVVPGINPKYNTAGGTMNCRRCTYAYELRRRGYDVSATPSAIGYGQSETGAINARTPGERNVNSPKSLSSMVVSGAQGIRTKVSGDTRKSTAETFSHANAKDSKGLSKLFSEQPSGARGEAVFNFGGFGHSLAYERFGSKTYIFDTQKGKRYDVGNAYEYDSFIGKWGRDSVKDVALTRLDNVALDHKFLSRWATNAPQHKLKKG